MAPSKNKAVWAFGDFQTPNDLARQPYLYPMLKSSDISNRSIDNISKSSGQIATHRKYMIVTQKSVGEETSSIQQKAPRLWDYLQQHKAKFQ